MRNPVTIIIPTCRGCLFDSSQLNIATIGHLENVQVLIIHTGNSEVSHKIKSSSITSPRVTELAEPDPGLLAGRHRGLQEAEADILIYLDDDVRLAEGWLEAMLEPFEDPHVHLVGCRYYPEYEVKPPDWLEQLWRNDSQGRYLTHLSLLDYGKETKKIDPTMVWGLCFAIRRQSLIRLGGFHPDAYPWELRRYRGDGETAPTVLARQLKLKTIYQGKTVVYHRVPRTRMTVEYFERRSYLQGISDSYTKFRTLNRGVASGFSWTDYLRPIKRFLCKKAMPSSTRLDVVDERMARAYRAGYEFHQKEVLRDPKLLEWILRECYWDYRLPEGWGKYVSTSAAL